MYEVLEGKSKWRDEHARQQLHDMGYRGYQLPQPAKTQAPATSSGVEAVNERQKPEVYPSPTPQQMLKMRWSIIPVGPDKKPLIASWKEFQSRQPMLEEVMRWDEFLHPARWALVTGKFGGRIVLDFDGEAGAVTMQWLGLLPHRRTPSGGYHVDFVYPGHRVPTLNAKSKKSLQQKYPGMDIRGDGGYAVVTGQGYEWLRDPAAPLGVVPIDFGNLDGETKPNGGNHVLRYERQLVDARQLIDMALERLGYEGRNDAGFWLACQLRDNGYSEREALRVMQDYATRCPGTNTKGDDEPYTNSEIRATLAQAYSRAARGPWGKGATSVHHTESSEPGAAFSAAVTEPAQRTPTSRAAPVAPTLRPAALYGLAGDIVRVILPCSEANDATLLLHLLTGYGNLIGRSAYYKVENTRHYCNLFYCAVGDTSRGRKGTAWGQVRPLLAEADPTWAKSRIQSGLSSGEGLIAAVADRDDQKNDKRLLVVQTEFASVLRVMNREGNTLSAVIRQAWDDGALDVLTKRDPLHVGGAHIAIISHVTKEEVKRSLSETESANGFANRFLWARSQRSKFLPEGAEINQTAIHGLVEKLRSAMRVGNGVEQMRRDKDAKEWWAAEYKRLSEGVPGLLGAVTSRAEAQVLRLSMVYALLDCTDVIRVEHLEAAKAVWDYCFDSAKYIFGSSLGYPLADEIWDALRTADDAGLSRTEISSNILNRNHSASHITTALAFLEERGLAHRRTVGEGRSSTEVWYVGPRIETGPITTH